MAVGRSGEGGFHVALTFDGRHALVAEDQRGTAVASGDSVKVAGDEGAGVSGLASSFADSLDTLLRSGTASDRQIQSLGTTEKRLRSIKRTGSTVEVDLVVMAKKGSLLGVGLISKCFAATVDTAVLTDRRHRVTPMENCR
ncbi:hypothetical protein [Streptosporangium roseum]|uniref:hypothetical protein n=1 Tax=Streptosporangium roseum TaxID=2001 RepID=UPI00332F850A